MIEAWGWGLYLWAKMRGNPSFSPFLKSEDGDSKGQSPFVMIKQYHFSKIIFDEIRNFDRIAEIIIISYMEYSVIQQQIEDLKKNPKIIKALEVFERTQKIYEKSIAAMKIKVKLKSTGTYSSTISKKDYFAQYFNDYSINSKIFPLRNKLNL